MKTLEPCFYTKFLLFILLISFCVTINAQNKNYAIANISAEISKDANSVVRYDYQRFAVKSAKDATLTIKQVVSIFNEDSNWTSVYIHYNRNKKIKKIKAAILDAYGREVRNFSKNDMLDQSATGGSLYSDSRVKIIDFTYGVYPYTIVCEYEVNYSGLRSYPTFFVQQYNSGVEHAELIVEMPPELPLRYRAVNVGAEPETVVTERKHVYQWKFEELPVVKKEDFMPSRYEILPRIDLEPTAFEYEEYKGDMSSWNSFGGFLYKLNKGRDELSPAMKNRVKTLTAGLESSSEKIAVLYRYLQENMRYVSVQLGIGGWQTFDAAYVEKNKFGDCKALSYFMKAMLQEAGVAANTAVIYSSRKNKITHEETFASPMANHMILYVPDDDVWLECTSTHNPPGYFGSSNADRSALLVTEDGGKLVRTPALIQQDNYELAKATIKLMTDGSAVVENSAQFAGLTQEWYRYASFNFDLKEQKDKIFNDKVFTSFELGEFKLQADTEKPIVNLDFDMQIYRYASKAGKRLFVPLNVLNPYDNIPDKTEKRIHPIQIHNAYMVQDDFTFELPEGYKIESIPAKDIVLDTEFGKYVLKITETPGKVIYSRMLEVNALRLEADRYDDFRNFYKELAAADQMKMVLVKK